MLRKEGSEDGAEQARAIARIAEALERLAPRSTEPDLSAHPAYRWSALGLEAVPKLNAQSFTAFAAIDRQKAQLLENTQRHAQGRAAHDVLLWGARGMGKSALVRAVAAETGAPLVEVAPERIAELESLFGKLARQSRPFLVLIDDFGVNEHMNIHRLRSLLDGGVAPRPDNVRLYVTSNRRHLVPRGAGTDPTSVHERDDRDDELALAERFGLSLGFHEASQADYLAICRALAAERGLEIDETEALAFARTRGARSGRIAAHYVTELAGRAPLPAK